MEPACEWSLKHHLIACMRGTFEVLLEMNGLDVCDGLVVGLIPKCDYREFTKEFPVITGKVALR